MANLPAAVVRTTRAKSVPPSPAAPLVRRARLEAMLDQGATRRLTTVVAEAGFGKSTLVTAWDTQVRRIWYSLGSEDRMFAQFGSGLSDAVGIGLPEIPREVATVLGRAGRGDVDGARGFAALLCEALHESLEDDLVLIIDNIEELEPESASAALVEDLCRQAPPRLHLILAGRADPPFKIDRLRGAGHVVELTGSDLAFTAEETAELLDMGRGIRSPSTAAQLHAATNGWPAALRLVLEAVRSEDEEELLQLLSKLQRPGGKLFSYLAEEVFGNEPPQTRMLIHSVAPLELFTPELCDAIGAVGSSEVIASLVRRGLFVEPSRRKHGWFSLNALIRDFALEQLPLQEWELRDVHDRAAEWLEAHHHYEEALASVVVIGEPARVADLLVEHGDTLLTAGAVQAVAKAGEMVPPGLRRPHLDRILGEAGLIRGDWDMALRSFERARAGETELAPDLAWRIGLIHHLRGETERALEVYRSGSTRDDGDKEVALLLGWTASVHWLRGENDECDAFAKRALEVATRSGDAQALAGAHTALGLLASSRGDRRSNHLHYLEAMRYAEDAGDMLQLTRIRGNRGSLLLEEGRYEEALAELDAAIRLADLGGLTTDQAINRMTRGDAYVCIGRLEEAAIELEYSRSLYQQIDSRMICYPLAKLGDLHRVRGERALARASYEEAISQAEQAHDVQGLVPALSGLARTLARDEPELAAELAERAVAAGTGLGYVGARIASGWVAVGSGDADAAARRAEEAAVAARDRRDRAGLAEALELWAAASKDRSQRTNLLEEAATIRHAIKDPIGVARIELALGHEAGDADRLERARERLTGLGAIGWEDPVFAPPSPSEGVVEVQTLGGFRVVIDGVPVPQTAWQSKKARDILKMLIAHRGRPVPREALMDRLWPDEDPERLGNRLSVALATVRSIMDPGKRFEPDHFIGAIDDAVFLNVGSLNIDVERFLEDALSGAELERSGRTEEAVPLFRAAEAGYRGDFLEEDPYAEWSVSLREEARALYIRVAHSLARSAAAEGDAFGASRYLLRILERDPYDESAHLRVIESRIAEGRHGEARRAYLAYRTRMKEIGVEPSPYPGEPQARPNANAR